MFYILLKPLWQSLRPRQEIWGPFHWAEICLHKTSGLASALKSWMNGNLSHMTYPSDIWKPIWSTPSWGFNSIIPLFHQWERIFSPCELLWNAMEFAGYVLSNFSIPQLNRLADARLGNQGYFLPLGTSLCYLRFLQRWKTLPLKRLRNSRKEILSHEQHKFLGTIFVLSDLTSEQRISHKLNRFLRK